MAIRFVVTDIATWRRFKDELRGSDDSFKSPDGERICWDRQGNVPFTPEMVIEISRADPDTIVLQEDEVQAWLLSNGWTKEECGE